MPSPQTLRSRGTTATFTGDTVVIERAEERTTIPLRVIRTIRTAEGHARTVEITLTDAAVHTIAANNATAAATFVTGVGDALPPRRDERGSALVRTEASSAPRLFTRRSSLALFLAGVAAYLAYVAYLVVSHGPSTLFGAVIGLLPLGLGVLAAYQTLQRLYVKAVLLRRGVTVEGRSTGMRGKKSVYVFTDAQGHTRRYESALHADILQIAYDPTDPKRMASATPLILEIPRVILMVLFTGLFLAVGVGAVFGPVLP
ncbi:hypothetical protein [Streptomyces sp. NPDC006645]|uniref:hypothetical protein n=1 Tax=unclassified Streptomyces TaxID=2593676 RepID=UPI0033AB3AC5